MSVNIVTCMFVLDSEKNDNIRKNDIKRIKILTDINNKLPRLRYTGNDIKKETRDYLEKIVGTNLFHLEQVYTLDYEKDINIIYLAITNINHTDLDSDYKLIDFNVEKNKTVTFGEDIVNYKTIPIEINNNIEYDREFDTLDKDLKLELVISLIAYKRIRSNIDNTDIIFKFMDSSFTLEDVRIVYELITEKEVDKSNFRKKIVKYCEKTKNIPTKTGYRPSQRYKFKPLKEDIWL